MRDNGLKAAQDTAKGQLPELLNQEKMMRKRLIFRVDDLGYTEAYDLGAVRAFDEGIASSADIMLDSPHTKEILHWVKDRPWLSIGWHRHLWESPVLSPSQVPSLVDERGRFK